ncbi:MAG: hypothetical protein ACRDTA_16800, partial [Pseudonocardiaceae bacterium]
QHIGSSAHQLRPRERRPPQPADAPPGQPVVIADSYGTWNKPPGLRGSHRGRQEAGSALATAGAHASGAPRQAGCRRPRDTTDRAVTADDLSCPRRSTLAEIMPCVSRPRPSSSAQR